MTFKQFCQKIYQGITEFYGDEVTVEIKVVAKNNGVKLTGLLITEGEKKVAPSIYLDSYFQDYQSGREIANIILDIINLYEKIRKNPPIEIQFFSEYEKVKKRICFKLIHFQKNETLLKEIPHVRYLNLAVVFYHAYENPYLGSGSILIRNVHKEGWGVTTEDLYLEAKENTGRLFPPELIGMEELMLEMLDGECEEIEKMFDDKKTLPMYVLTNRCRQFGAISIFYPKILNELSKKTDSNLYILPSSVHEVILLPDVGEEVEKLREMVRDVNETQVAEEEILSYSIYYYDQKEGQISQVC